jgi:hypothetical protein
MDLEVFFRLFPLFCRGLFVDSTQSFCAIFEYFKVMPQPTSTAMRPLPPDSTDQHRGYFIHPFDPRETSRTDPKFFFFWFLVETKFSSDELRNLLFPTFPYLFSRRQEVTQHTDNFSNHLRL